MTTGVIAFGHVHFKRACEVSGLDWQQVRHVTSIRRFKGVTSVLLHITARDRRQSHLVIEAKRLGLI